MWFFFRNPVRNPIKKLRFVLSSYVILERDIMMKKSSINISISILIPILLMICFINVKYRIILTALFGASIFFNNISLCDRIYPSCFIIYRKQKYLCKNRNNVKRVSIFYSYYFDFFDIIDGLDLWVPLYHHQTKKNEYPKTKNELFTTS